MLRMNQTVPSFLLSGFQNIQAVNTLLFVVILCIYILTLVGNVLLIILVVKVPALRSPMYVLLSQLSLADILMTTNITPNLLWLLLRGGGKVLVTDCLAQFFLFGVSTSIECFLLTAMSYDRYLAICNPLRYSSIMDFRVCLNMSLWCWGLSFMVALVLDLLMSHLEFCGPFLLDHYFCDFSPVLKLSCSDIKVLELTDIIFTIPVILLPFCFIIFTYVAIGLAILRISSTEGRHKAFSTCSSHLIVVCTFYGTLITVYLVPSKDHTFNINKTLSLLYTVATPFLNPVIYSLRNKEIKVALHKCMSSLFMRLFHSLHECTNNSSRLRKTLLRFS
ncbi:olfactory receptor 11A1-like [Xenopus tropicalis]|uniref:Olfactory receptor n=1 Tax=Xenopus tropicalis TaxID=8364 RepID=A0A8J0QXZ4_XENTR|nr:olfactory receptor 11A1-like [Xenopus tropicalis]